MALNLRIHLFIVKASKEINGDAQENLNVLLKYKWFHIVNGLRGHNWMHFSHRPLCIATLNLNLAILKS